MEHVGIYSKAFLRGLQEHLRSVYEKIPRNKNMHNHKVLVLFVFDFFFLRIQQPGYSKR